jgi:hypothetical protein
MRRDKLPFPWKSFSLFVLLPLAIIATATVAVMIVKFGWKPVPYWPFLIR